MAQQKQDKIPDFLDLDASKFLDDPVKEILSRTPLSRSTASLFDGKAEEERALSDEEERNKLMEEAWIGSEWSTNNVGLAKAGTFLWGRVRSWCLFI